MKIRQFAAATCVALIAWTGVASAGGWRDLLCRDDLTLGAEVLYYNVCAPEYNYGFAGSAADAGNYLGIKPSGQWGFRLFGRVASDDCCSFVQLGWTRLSVNQSFGRFGASRVHPGTNTVEVNGGMTHRYNNVNLRVGRAICRDCDSQTYVFGGLRYLNIERRANEFNPQEEGDVVIAQPEISRGEETREKSAFNGGAVEFGVGTNYYVGCGFYLHGSFAGVAGVGERKFKSYGSNVGADWSSSEKAKTACIAGLDARLAVRYSNEYCCPCWTSSLCYTWELGYAAEYYFNALTTGIQYENGGNGPFLPQTSNIGFVGPYLSLSLHF